MEENTQKNTKVLNYIIIFFLLIIFGGLTYYYFSFTKANTSSNTEPSPTANTETLNISTADWKIYTNPVHKISFSYPPDWELKVDNDQLPSFASIKLVKNEAYIHMVLGLEGLEDKGLEYEGTPMTFAGKDVFEYKNTSSRTKMVNMGITDKLSNSQGVLTLNNKVYAINLLYPTKYVDSGESENIENIFNKILSTFKFTN